MVKLPSCNIVTAKKLVYTCRPRLLENLDTHRYLVVLLEHRGKRSKNSLYFDRFLLDLSYSFLLDISYSLLKNSALTCVSSLLALERVTKSMSVQKLQHLCRKFCPYVTSDLVAVVDDAINLSRYVSAR